MRKEDDAPDPIINACNEFYCDAFLPNKPYKPKMWTEAWSGCFKKASNVQGGGSWISSGGVNLESGGNVDVAGNGAHSQAHGLIREPKYGHLQKLHKAIKLCESALVSSDPTVKSIGKYQQDKVPLISPSGLHQLHIFIFVLAVLHIMYSVMTIGFAQAKLKKWKSWELETSSLEYQFTNDPSRFRFAHQTSFVRRHSGLPTMPGVGYIVAFFRQFFSSVTKVDYMTMRHGFINAHFAPNSKFNFHKYIKRSMEDDFMVVVGIELYFVMYKRQSNSGT
ncbi:hypothetical protein POM88_021911 [Heracleum sosnowskyi]|uniref:Uncharacterized protein n=1 Tax=Heracleum sosnowskyi TaxID=360622 RepID=A0AAD8IFT5_9APIA|nr:hypothetical protein POM88_021911 [Heracleum sosnowskyi]